jgi:hypothetical protein
MVLLNSGILHNTSLRGSETSPKQSKIKNYYPDDRIMSIPAEAGIQFLPLAKGRVRGIFLPRLDAESGSAWEKRSAGFRIKSGMESLVFGILNLFRVSDLEFRVSFLGG